VRAFGIWPGFVEVNGASRSGFEHTRFDLAHDVHFTGFAIKAQREFFFAVD
jgi:hypothetical protein